MLQLQQLQTASAVTVAATAVVTATATSGSLSIFLQYKKSIKRMSKTKVVAVLLLLLEIVCAGGTFSGKHVYWMTSTMPFCCSGVVSVL